MARSSGLRLPGTIASPVVRVACAMLMLLVSIDAAAATVARYRLGGGWATFGIAVPRGVAPMGSALRVGTLPTQTDVKTRWDDGSMRFAVVTAQVPAAASYEISIGANDPGTFMPAWPAVAVDFAMGGARWTAEAPAAPADAWLSGPLVREARAIVAPRLGTTSHPLLRVIFDLRAYRGGGHRVDVTVENCLDVAAADAARYDVVVRIGQRIVFEKPSVTHGYLARWRRVFSDRLQEAEVTPDFLPFTAAQAIPLYLSTIESKPRTTTGTQFDILGTGDLMVPMNAHGGRPELAPYPDWTAQYLVHRKPDQREYVLRHGDAAASWGVHIKEPDGIRLISIDDHPNFWLDDRAPADGRPQVVAANGTLRGLAVAGDIAHQPSLAFVPYLITGDRFYLDEMKYWANYCLLATQPYDYARNGSQGLLVSNEIRGIGWGLRNLADTAAYLPDSDPDRAYLAPKVRNNLRWLERYANTFESTLDTVFTGHRRWAEDSARPPHAWIALWEHIYVAWAIDRALQLGFTPGAALRDRIARFQLKLFTSEREGFDPSFAGAYVLAVAETRTVPERWTYLTTLREVFRLAQANGDYRPFPGYYGPEARLMLLVAQAQRWPRAAESLAYLMGTRDQDVTMIRDLNRRSGWAIADVGMAPQMTDAGSYQPATGGTR